LSLKTKPFVLLAGISGTGKTKLVELFSEAIGYELDIIPVKPDWNDMSDLLGYNNIEGKFIEGPLYKVLKKANENPNDGYIVCLDEMNLARVEYYFSDILSRMETKNKEIDLSGEKIKLPSNLYIVGTVNMDETTHPFSKKVLDRANTIEFSNVNLNQLSFNNKYDNEYEKLNLDNSFLNPDYERLIDFEEKYHSFIKDNVVSKLVKINSILKKANLHIGYRIRDEVCYYMLYNKKYNLMTFEKALDYQMMQKILPRIQGSSQSIKELLISLFELFTKNELERDEYKILKEMEKVLNTELKYPMSSEKVYYMFKNYKEDGFTAYWL
ncbi:MAG: McrB family protein, partial [Bacillota bacterium]